jgi:hypothetical protein
VASGAFRCDGRTGGARGRRQQRIADARSLELVAEQLRIPSTIAASAPLGSRQVQHFAPVRQPG